MVQTRVILVETESPPGSRLTKDIAKMDFQPAPIPGDIINVRMITSTNPPRSHLEAYRVLPGREFGESGQLIFLYVETK